MFIAQHSCWVCHWDVDVKEPLSALQGAYKAVDESEVQAIVIKRIEAYEPGLWKKTLIRKEMKMLYFKDFLVLLYRNSQFLSQ